MRIFAWDVRGPPPGVLAMVCAPWSHPLPPGVLLPAPAHPLSQPDFGFPADSVGKAGGGGSIKNSLLLHIGVCGVPLMTGDNASEAPVSVHRAQLTAAQQPLSQTSGSGCLGSSLWPWVLPTLQCDRAKLLIFLSPRGVQQGVGQGRGRAGLSPPVLWTGHPIHAALRVSGVREAFTIP